MTLEQPPSPLLPDAREAIAAPGCPTCGRAAGAARRDLRWFAMGSCAAELTTTRRQSWLAPHEATGPEITALRRDPAALDGHAFPSGPAGPL
jgi:hypothetical protein